MLTSQSWNQRVASVTWCPLIRTTGRLVKFFHYFFLSVRGIKSSADRMTAPCGRNGFFPATVSSVRRRRGPGHWAPWSAASVFWMSHNFCDHLRTRKERNWKLHRTGSATFLTIVVPASGKCVTFVCILPPPPLNELALLLSCLC